MRPTHTWTFLPNLSTCLYQYKTVKINSNTNISKCLLVLVSFVEFEEEFGDEENAEALNKEED